MAKHAPRETAGPKDLAEIVPTFTTIEITKDYLHFSAAHFTIFSATQRENLHGHNFDVGCVIETLIGSDGLAFDYNLIKDKLKALCDELDERTLLPEQSPFLSLIACVVKQSTPAMPIPLGLRLSCPCPPSSAEN